MRKPIQITAVQSVHSGVSATDSTPGTVVVALCSDDTVWMINSTEGSWVPLPPIPTGKLLDEWLESVGRYLVHRHKIDQGEVQAFINKRHSQLVDEHKRGTEAYKAADIAAGIPEDEQPAAQR